MSRAISRINFWWPPYAGPQERNRSALAHPTGTIAIFTVSEDEPLNTPGSIPEDIVAFSKLNAGVPIGMTLPSEPRGKWLSGLVESKVGRNGREARMIFLGEPTSMDIRRAATEWTVDAVSHWLHTHFPPRDLSDAGLILCLSEYLTHGDTPVRWDCVTACALRRLGLPSRHKWSMLRQAIGGVIVLQRERVTVAEAARWAGYSEPRAFRRHCDKLFGIPPSTLRIYAGWELPLERFTSRCQPAA